MGPTFALPQTWAKPLILLCTQINCTTQCRIPPATVVSPPLHLHLHEEITKKGLVANEPLLCTRPFKRTTPKGLRGAVVCSSPKQSIRALALHHHWLRLCDLHDNGADATTRLCASHFIPNNIKYPLIPKTQCWLAGSLKLLV